MKVTQTKNGSILTLALEGRLDTTTTEILRAEVSGMDSDITGVIFDMDRLEYISSAGLRQLLTVRKRFGSNSDVKLINCSELIMDVIRMTGFDSMMEVYGKEQSFIVPANQSYKDLLAQRVKETPDFPFLTYGDEVYTWQDIDRCSQIVAADLSRAGVKKFSHVGIVGSNSANFLITFFAVQKLGAIAMLQNFNLKYPEVVDQCDIGDITFYCVGETASLPDIIELREQLIADKGCDVGFVYDIRNSVNFRARLSEYEDVKDLFTDPVEADDPCVMIYSSGSTGKPKGILLSAFNVINGARLVISRAHMVPEDSCCLIMPLFHIFGLKDGLTISTLLNNRLVLPKDNRTDTIIEVLEKEKCTLFHSVPTMMLAILNNKNFTSEKLAHVRVTELAGAAMAEAQMRMLMEKLPNDHFTCAYGLSEIAPVSITEYGDTVEHLCTTVGRPADNVQVRINDPATGKDVPAGGRGEILVRGDSLMTCYYKRAADDQAVDADDWLHTGDLGVLDEEGYLHIVGRIKEIIIRGGENIIPGEIASAMSEHENVSDVKVLGIPDDFYGEVVGACVTLRDKSAWNPAEMNTFLASRIAKYKIPSFYLVFDEFPALPNGKVDGVTMKKILVEKATGKRA